jgi:aspartate 4-decarboxylase
MNHRQEEKRYESLSPFELKNKLVKLARNQHERMMMNAGRGNPNWVSTYPREAYFLLGSFALQEARRVMSLPGLAGSPRAEGMGERLLDFCKVRSEQVGAQFLADSYKLVTEKFALNGDAFVSEMVDGILGDHYPVPDRVLRNTEVILREYLNLALCDGQAPTGNLDIFATEGGTAAMTYTFNTLKENGFIKPGDKIALGTPIFTPYLEIPVLNDYELEVVEIRQSEDQDWQFPDSEIEKLADPAIKAFFLVNPSNPASVSIDESSLQKLADLVNHRRKDLIILTDDVYGTFVDGFKSLVAIAPRNTILVYSYSKYFGATGWRLGVIAIHEDNILDEAIANLPQDRKKELHQRYESIVTDPSKLKFIDRLVADSRAVALNHTAGLSTPQQVMMVLFSLQELLDQDSRLYRKEVQDILHRRFDALYQHLGEGIEEPSTPCYSRYYTTIDIRRMAENRHGTDFAAWLKSDHEPIDFVWRLASDKGSSNMRFENNLVYNVSDGGFHQHYGRGNTVRNNILAFSEQEQVRGTVQQKAGDHLSFSFERNIVYFDQGELFGRTFQWEPEVQVNLKNNIYWRAGGKSFGFAGKSWDQWRAMGRDKEGSVIADPKFVDPGKRDFRFASDAVIKQTGFQPFDYSQAGVYGDPVWIDLAKATRN